MIRLLALLLVLAARPVFGDVAGDAFSENNESEVDPTWTHTPVGTPRGILVFFGRVAAESVVGVTYGGVAMTPVATVTDSAGGETAGVALDAYFLGSSVPTGAQTVAINSGATAVPNAYAISVTAGGDVEFIDDATANSANVSNVSTTVSLGGRTSFVAEIWQSGEDAVTSVSPLTNWTAAEETDTGSQTAGSYTYDVIGTADVTAGLTQSSDDILLLAVAISEVVAPGGTVIPAASQNYRRRRN